LRLVAHIHALRKIRFGGSKAMDPKLFCHYFISSFFSRERDILFFQRVFIIVHQILIFLAKLKQGWDKAA